MRLGASKPLMAMPALRLALISFLALYFELALIRWVPTQVRLVAYFTNFVLIAALLGLGVGMLLAGRRARLLGYFAPALLVLTLLVVLLESANFVLPIVSQGQFVWNYIHTLPANGFLAYGVLVGFFLLVVGVFALLGQEVGLALRPFGPLPAYSINILGSLVGVVAFAFVSYLGLPPAIWFAVGAAGLVVYLLLSGVRNWGAITTVSLIAVLAVVHADAIGRPEGLSRFWSPYYEIEVSPLGSGEGRIGYDIRVNKDSHQHALDLSDQDSRNPYLARRGHLYEVPYELIRPRRVLVVGAGTGNDVAAALRMAPGAMVDAVEIDPVIADLGRKLHPERPYDHPNVRVHIDDARSFLQKSDTKYDLVVFGFLDSHRLFSHMSSVRMDNYVYTLQNFEGVRRHLAPGGVVAVTFSVHEKWIADRLFAVMKRAFDREPAVYEGGRNAWGTIFISGTNDIRLPQGARTVDRQTFESRVLGGDQLRTWQYTDVEGFVDPAAFSDQEEIITDEWPYLYMRERGVPANYLTVLALTVLVSLLLIAATVPRIDFRRPSNWNFLLLGAAFALLETRGITEIALVFGSTWITNSIVISAILAMILLANLVVSRTPNLPLRWMYLALFAALLFNYSVSLRGLLELGFWAQVIAAGVQVAGPLFFSGIIFARWFQQVESPSSALGANLMGAVLGGLLEYGSLAVGLRQLYLAALLFYVLSFGLTFVGLSSRRAPTRGVAA